MNRIIYWLAIAAPALVSLAPDAGCGQQGIEGHVYRVKGNQMPSPDLPRSKPAGMKTTLYIYELTNASQVSQEGAFYKSISTKLVKEIPTDDSGYFKVPLNPGWYSLFVKKGDLFYANIFDDKNNIHPVEVKKGEWKEENFKADYDAVY
jgi:hypothetical protein